MVVAALSRLGGPDPNPIWLYVYAIGGSEEHARRAGIAIGPMKVAIYAISGLYAGIAGVGLAARIGSGYTLAGQGFELDSIVAVVLGGTSLAGGRGGVPGTIGSVLFLTILSNGLNLGGHQPLRPTGGEGSGRGGGGRAVHAGRGAHERRSVIHVGRSRWRKSLAVLDRLGVWVALALLIVVASALSPYFFSLNNFLNILNQASVVGVAAVGMTLVMITGGVDLSVGSIISLSADICATVMNGSDARIGLAVALSIAAGAAVGFVNGVLVAKRNLPSFILTLGTAAAVQGLGLLYTGGTASGAVAPWFQSTIGGRPWAHIPGVVPVFLAVAAIGLLIQETTALGSRLYLVGSNIRAAYFSGIAVDRVLILAYTLSGAIAGIAGIVMLASVGVSSAFAGQTYTFDALAAVLLGGTTFQGGRGGILGTLAGVLILVVAFNLVNILGLNFNLQLVAEGRHHHRCGHPLSTGQSCGLDRSGG